MAAVTPLACATSVCRFTSIQASRLRLSAAARLAAMDVHYGAIRSVAARRATSITERSCKYFCSASEIGKKRSNMPICHACCMAALSILSETRDGELDGKGGVRMRDSNVEMKASLNTTSIYLHSDEGRRSKQVDAAFQRRK